ncbi:hypothetical protein H1R20_g3668, partial [Candolleomyces eurysporus]
MDCKEPFDAVIIGAGIAGSAMAHALATTPRSKPWRIALIERSFSEPDRIVGELLQPGGVQALRELGMLSSLDEIEAMPVEGYNMIKDAQSIQISYPKGEEGRSFHHGRFVMGLRRIALQNENVTAIEGNAKCLIECSTTHRVLGVDVTLKTPTPADTFERIPEKLAIYGGLVIVADGCFSNFRNTVLGKSACKPKTCSHTISTVLKDVALPVPKYGTIVLPRGLGPVGFYQLTERETRIWVDVQGTLPSDVQGYLVERLVPELPESLRECAKEAFTTNRVRKMPNSFLPPMQQATSSTKKGVFLLGDSFNMRSPITGGGMTVALKDVVYLRRAFKDVSLLEDWSQVGPIIRRWHWAPRW